MEACWNWGWLYDLLVQIEQMDEVVLAHPYKTRIDRRSSDQDRSVGRADAG